MHTQLKVLLLSSLSVLLAACSDPPVDDASANKAIVVDPAMGGMGAGGLKGIDLNALGAMAALEDDKNYAVGGVQPLIYFGYDRFDVDEKGQATVSHYARYLQTKPMLNVVLEGHCDERGSSEYNMALGERRANAVKEAMVFAGIPASRIKSVSFGEEKPAAEGHDEVSWGKNRRVELRFPQ